MWCRSCQQDVAGISSGSSGELACARCASPFIALATSSLEPNSPASAKPTAAATPKLLPLPLDERDWELEQELRSAERLLRSLGVARVDSPHASGKRVHVPAPHAPRTDNPGSKIRDSNRAFSTTAKISSFLAWLLIALGLTTGVFGGALLLISRFTGRPELWGTGTSFGVVGQVFLVFGMFLQQEAMQRQQRVSEKIIADLQSELKQLERQAEEFRAEGLSRSLPSPISSDVRHFELWR